MPAISASVERRRCLRSLPWLLLSLAVCTELGRRRRDSARAADQATRELIPLLERQAQIVQLDVPGAPGAILADVMVHALDVLRSAEWRHGVRIDQLAIPGRGATLLDGPADLQTLNALARPLPGVPALRALRLDVRASYRSYPGLKDWLGELGALPLCVRRLYLEDQRVQMVIDLFGA